MLLLVVLVDPHVGLDAVLELNEVRREDLGELLTPNFLWVVREGAHIHS